MNWFISFAFLLSTVAFSCWADSQRRWPAWRGPEASGSSWKGSYPSNFDAVENLLWKVSLPGKGCSTPVVWDDHVLLTSPVEGKDAVLAFDWNGRKHLQTQVGDERKASTGTGREATLR